MNEPLVFDPMSEEFRRNIIDKYRRFLREDPVHQLPDGRWLLTKHKDVSRALNESENFLRPIGFTSGRHQPGPLKEWARDNFVGINPPEHTRLRRALAPAFSPKKVAEMEKAVEGMTEELVNSLPSGNVYDFIQSFALPLPIAVICRMMDIPVADYGLFHDSTSTVLKALEIMSTPEDGARAHAATAQLRDYLGAIMKEREGGEGEDLLSILVRNEAVAGMTRLESVHAAISMLIAGHETTTHLLGNGLLALMRNPDQMQILRDEPGLINNAVEEFLRYDPPIYTIFRTNTADMDIGGKNIPANSFLFLGLAAANRDPDMFPNPDQLDVRRTNANRHLSFAGGIHLCIGLSIARIEARMAFRKLLERFKRFEMQGEPTPRQGLMFKGCLALPVKAAA